MADLRALRASRHGSTSVRIRRIVLAVALVLWGVALGAGLGSRPVHGVTVGSEAELRSAFGDPSETEVVLSVDVSLTDCSSGALTRPAGSGPMLVEGGGFTLTQTCPGERVITNDGGELELRNLTVTGGTLDAGDDEAFGGGVFSAGTLRLITAVVSDNRADGQLGGAGGGVATTGALVIDRSVVEGNLAAGGRSVFGGRGGGVYAEGRTEIVDSAIADNTAGGAPGAGGSGGGVFVNNDVILRRSTIARNTAAAGSAGDGGAFGGVVANGGLQAINSTVHANTAVGTRSQHGGLNAAGELALVYSAVTANSAESGSANVVFKRGDRSTASVVSEALGGAASCSAAVGVSGGYNFADDTSCGFVAATDREGAGDPGLGDLGVDIGPTPVRVPSSDGPLVDAIPAADCVIGDAAAITTDQQGTARPQNDACDIGPVELMAMVPPSTEPTVPPTEPTAPPTEPTVTPTDPSTTGASTMPTTTTPAPTNPSIPQTTPSTSPIAGPDPSGPLPGTGTTVAIILVIAAGLIAVGVMVRRRSVRPASEN
ncbi:MAG: choice-of-anchor Q domain-containing protein [Actinomycetota bacterium]